MSEALKFITADDNEVQENKVNWIDADEPKKPENKINWIDADEPKKPESKVNWIDADEPLKKPAAEKPAEPANKVNWIDADDPDDPSPFTIKQNPGSIFLNVVDRDVPAKEAAPEPELPDETWERLTQEAEQRQKELEDYYEDFGPDNTPNAADATSKAKDSAPDKGDVAPVPADDGGSKGDTAPTGDGGNKGDIAPAPAAGEKAKPNDKKPEQEVDEHYTKSEIIEKIKREIEEREREEAAPWDLPTDEEINEAVDDAETKEKKEKKRGFLRRILDKMRKHHWGFANPRRKKPETASEDKTKETKDDGKDKEKDTTNKDDTKTSEKTRFVGEKHESEANANELAKDIYAALAEADVNPAKLVEVTARAMALRDASGLLNNRLTYSSDENRSFERTNLENAIQAANWQFSRGNWGTLQRRRTEILRDLLNIKN